LHRLRVFPGQRQRAAFLKHSFRLAEQGALFVSQRDKFVGERVCGHRVAADDMSII
jgi:hypothetical protein